MEDNGLPSGLRLIPPDPGTPEQQKRRRNIVIGIVAIGIVAAVYGLVHADRSDSQPVAQQAPREQPQQVEQRVSTQNILTKDPDYEKLTSDPNYSDLLEYSESYRNARQQISSRTQQLSDPELRDAEVRKEWAAYDTSSMSDEARAQMHSDLVALLQKRRDAWFEVGHLKYSIPDTRLNITSVPASPMSVSGGYVLVDAAVMDQVYSKFRTIVQSTIDQQVSDHRDQWNQHSDELCRAIQEAGLACGDTSFHADIEGQKIESDLRDDRLIMVAQGDIPTQRIDKLMLVDYDTEAIFWEFAPSQLTYSSIGWKFTDTPPTGTAAVTASTVPTTP